MPGLRSRGLGRDALLGVLLAVACAGLLVGALYALLALRGVFSDPSTPRTLGLALFALLHGGATSVEVPPNPALLGLGGSLRLGLPVTSFVLLPFVASLLLARLLARRTQAAVVFVLGAAVAYALVVAVLAAFGAVSADAGGATVRLAPDPLSVALRGFLWVGLGAMLGTAAACGPLLPVRPRQVLRGALWGVGVSVVVTLVLTVAIALAQQGLGASTPQATGDPSQTISSESTLTDGLAGVGAIFTLLPTGLGTLWLLAHGVPVGFQNAPDLSGIPLVGEALADVPLRVSLVADWPWGDAWRLLLVAPVIGLVYGGRVAARGAPQADRWWQGASAGVAYAAIAILTALLVGLTADLTLAGAASLQAAFRASLAWLLLLLPAGAALGAVGGLLSRGEAAPAPRPRRAFIIASVIGVTVLVASLPVALAASSPGSVLPTTPAPFGGEVAEQPPFEAAPDATPQGATPEDRQTSEDPTPVASGSQDALPDPAFDPIFPTLRQTTTAPIMLPAELPDELGNVAVDADRGGDEYGVLFLYQPTGNVLESQVRANTVGTLTASPEPRDPAFGYVGVTSTETVELADGTEATLRYMDPSKEGYNQGPFWEGEFEDRGHFYTLSVFLNDPSGDVARRVLSSMVPVPGSGDTAEPGNPAPADLEAGAEQAAGDYYRAAGVEDWTYTYENLDSETQSLFTEEEWFQKNQWFASNGSVIYNILSVESLDTSGETVAEVSVQITGEDGSSSVRTTYFVLEDGTWKHRFGQEEYNLFMPGVPFDEFVAAQGG
ncbi:MAG: hypothetical protein M3R38_02185 [Actinomycetota bacterium]|nr:hypothetical protein [Actinomycetota bacterium]